MNQEALVDLRSKISSLLIEDGGRGEYRLNREVYTNAQLFDLEMQCIFAGNWTYVAHESQILNPHDFITTHIGLQPVVVSRTAQDSVVCMLNSCAHRGAVVCRKKAGNRKTHSCGFHGWTYDSGGALRGIPDQERGGYPDSLDKLELGLKRLRTESYRGFIFASLNTEVDTLEAYLGGAKTFIDMMVDSSPLGRLEVLKGTGIYTYNGNWKLSTENGLDGYHGLAVHGSYAGVYLRRSQRQSDSQLKVIDMSALAVAKGGFHAFENGHGIMWSDYGNWQDRPQAAHYAAYKSAYGQEKADWMVKRVRNLLLAPNVFLMDSASTQIRIVRPISVDRTEVTIYALAPVGESDAERENRLRQYEDFFNATGLATPDDLAEFNHCQAGFAASGLHWSELSRGATRCVDGDPTGARGLGYDGVLSGDGNEPGNEGIYRAMYRDWIKRIRLGLDPSQGVTS